MIRTKDKADAGRPEADVSVIYTDKMKKAALTPLKAGKSAVQYTADAKRSLQKAKPADGIKSFQIPPTFKNSRRYRRKIRISGVREIRSKPPAELSGPIKTQ